MRFERRLPGTVAALVRLRLDGEGALLQASVNRVALG